MAKDPVHDRLHIVFTVLAALATVAGASLAIWSGRTVDPLESGQLGLIEALPLTFFLGLGLILGAFIMGLSRTHLVRPLLVIQMFILIVLLYGLTSYVEDVARLPTTWVHAGFIDYIQRNDGIFENYDARFVWPGFFALGALLNELAGITDQGPILTWAPLVFNLAYAVPVWTIIRGAGTPLRACWLGTMLFFLLNWVGQDYYSPQGLNELFALCFLAVLIRVFFSHTALVPPWAQNTVIAWVRRRAPRLAERITKLHLAPGGPSRLAISGPQKASLIGVLILLYGASVISHQLTPFFLIIVTVLLVLLDRLQIRVLPVVMVVGVFVWISYAATSFWQGQLDQLFGDVGNLGNVFSQNVDNRVVGDPAHLPVIYGRLAVAAGLWLLALVGLIRRIRTGRLDVVCIVGFVAPFAILGGQAYGGEAVLRVYLYGLPFAAALAAMALAPSLDAWSTKTTALVMVVVLGLLPVFFITRYGNEKFENFTADELAVVNTAYAMAPDGAKMYSLNALLPWRGQRINTVEARSVADELVPPDELSVIRDALMDREAGEQSFLLVTRAQAEYARTTQGQAIDHGEKLVDQLVATGDFKVTFENAGGRIIEPSDQP